MASRGEPYVTGTDGSDFAHRQKVAVHYQYSALYKSRLRLAIFFHFLLFLVMCAKLLEDVLDRLDIFILELEELYIPKPLLWEWIWLGSLLFAFVGLSAARKNRVSSMQTYAYGTFLFGICPVVAGAAYYVKDLWQFIELRDSTGLAKWQGFPVAVLWYIFLAVSFQVHLFSLFFAMKLIRAWKHRTGKKDN